MNLAEGLQAELSRCMDLLAVYQGLGPVGTFGAIMIRACIDKAHAAQSSGDVVAMIQAYEDLKGCQ